MGLLNPNRAFITGITGQDGAYLAEFLLKKGYEVHGLVRWDSYADPLEGLQRLDMLGLVTDRVTLHIGDMTDPNNLNSVLKKIRPAEIYNLAALSHVKVSFETPASAFDINAKGTLNLLESIRILGMEESVRLYQASSSEMFGRAPAPQNEDTPMSPCSPYGVAKLAAYWLARNYRESYGIHVSNGILFNHESPLRGEDFVTRKITRTVAQIERGRNDGLLLGNLDAVRDWGYAKDYVEGMWLMLQQEHADDYVLATGQARTVREFVTRAFAHIGVDLDWEGQGLAEKAVDRKTGRIWVEVDPDLFRPLEVDNLLGDSSKARKKLGWMPRTDFDMLVGLMLNADRALLQDRPYLGQGLWQKTG